MPITSLNVSHLTQLSTSLTTVSKAMTARGNWEWESSFVGRQVALKDVSVAEATHRCLHTVEVVFHTLREEESLFFCLFFCLSRTQRFCSTSRRKYCKYCIGAEFVVSEVYTIADPEFYSLSDWPFFSVRAVCGLWKRWFFLFLLLSFSGLFPPSCC